MEMTVIGILQGPTRVTIIRAGGETFVASVGEPVGDAVVVAILPTKVVLKRGKATFDLPAPSAARAPLIPAVPRRSDAPAAMVPPRTAAPVPAAPRRSDDRVVPLRGAAPAPPGIGMIVTGILGGNSLVAIIQAGGQSFVAGAGDPVGDAVVVSVLPGKVVLKRNGVLFELPIGRNASS
jgi:hypothetical protein